MENPGRASRHALLQIKGHFSTGKRLESRTPRLRIPPCQVSMATMFPFLSQSSLSLAWNCASFPFRAGVRPGLHLTPSRVRQGMWPYRVQHFLVYGLVFRFRLLSTPSLDDAVSFSYGQPVPCPTGTFTPLLVRTLRRLRGASGAGRACGTVCETGHRQGARRSRHPRSQFP